MKTAGILGALGAVGVLGVTGCATAGARTLAAERSWSDLASRTEPSLHVGEARVIETRVNPTVPLNVGTEGGAVAVTFARPGQRVRSVAHLDATSLDRVSLDAAAPSDHAAAGPPGAARVVLEGGRFLMVWTRGDLELGRRAIAQEFRADGAPREAPVVLSSPDDDVMGPPRAVSTDGRHVVATFVTASEHGTALVAVPLEAADVGDAHERVAGR
jgi:hypothetical protein